MTMAVSAPLYGSISGLISSDRRLITRKREREEPKDGRWADARYFGVRPGSVTEGGAGTDSPTAAGLTKGCRSMRIKTAVSVVLSLLLALVSSAPAYAGTPGTAGAPPTPQIALSPESAAVAVNGRGAVIFGNYEQDNNIGNGKEPIEWLVLEAWGDRALLISKYGLDARPYNTEHGEVTWENCSLRKWLNGEFLNDAFTPEEQAAIVQMPVDNSEGQGYGGWSAAGGNNTEDRVFLLSCAEANKYLGVTFDNSDNMGSRMSPTAYALQAGALSSGMKTTDGTPTCAWWLLRP